MMIYPLMKMRYWSPSVLLYCCVFLPSDLYLLNVLVALMLGVYVLWVLYLLEELTILPLYNLSLVVFGLKSIFSHITIAIHKSILYRQHIIGYIFFFIYSTPFGWRILSSLLSHAVADISSPCPSSIFQTKYISALLVIGYGNTKVRSSCSTLKGWEAGHSLHLFLSWWGDLFLARKVLLGLSSTDPGVWMRQAKWSWPFFPFLQLFSGFHSTILVNFF